MSKKLPNFCSDGYFEFWPQNQYKGLKNIFLSYWILVFWAPYSSGGLGGGWGVIGWLGAPHTCAHTCTHMHIYTLNMIISIANGMCMCTCMCVHVHMCGGNPLTTLHPHPPTPTPQGGDPWNQSKFNSSWTNQDISILFEDLKSVETSPLMDGCIVWWVGWLVGSGQKTIKFKKCWLNQDNSILFEDLWFVETPSPMAGCMGGWVDVWGQWVGSGQMT